MALIQSLPLASNAENGIRTPKRGSTIYREPYYWNPVDNSTYSPTGNNHFRIDIPNTDIWDTQTAWIAFDLTITTNGISTDANPPYQRMSNGTWSFFERARHLSNLVPIEEIYPYWNIMSQRWAFEQTKELETILGPIVGVETKATRNAWGVTTKRLILPLSLGWLSAGPFPAKYLSTVHSIDMYLLPANQCIETNCSNPNYTITNVEYHSFRMVSKFPGLNIDSNDYSSNWEEGFARLVKAGRYEIMMDYYDLYQNSNLTQQGDYLIPVKTAAIQSVFSVFGNINTIATTNVPDKQMTFLKNNLGDFQLKVYSRLFPEQPVDCRNDGFQAYFFYLGYVNAWVADSFTSLDPTSPDSINESPVGIDEFNSTAFAMIHDFRSIRKEPAVNPIFNADQSAGDLRLTLRFDAPVPAGTVVYHTVKSSRIVKVTQDGVVIINLI